MNQIQIEKKLFAGAKFQWPATQRKINQGLLEKGAIDIVQLPINSRRVQPPAPEILTQQVITAMNPAVFQGYKYVTENTRIDIKDFKEKNLAGLKVIHDEMSEPMKSVLSKLPGANNLANVYDYLMETYSMVNLTRSDYIMLSKNCRRPMDPSEIFSTYVDEFFENQAALGKPRDAEQHQIDHAVQLILNLQHLPFFSKVIDFESHSPSELEHLIAKLIVQDNARTNDQYAPAYEISRLSSKRGLNSISTIDAVYTNSSGVPNSPAVKDKTKKLRCGDPGWKCPNCGASHAKGVKCLEPKCGRCKIATDPLKHNYWCCPNGSPYHKAAFTKAN
jgi:hypothetical protein